MSRRAERGTIDPALLGEPTPPGASGERSRWRGVLDWIRGAFVDNATLKFVALVLALTVFILVHSDESAVAGATVEVSYSLPDGKVLLSDPVEQLRITVRGSRRRLKRFDPAELGRVNLDLRGRGDGELVFEPSMIEGLPEGLELVSISPPSMVVKLGDRAEHEVRVIVETAGNPAHGFRVTSQAAVPGRVKVVGPAAAVRKVIAVRTEVVVIEGRSESVSEEVALSVPEGVTLEGVARVRVEVGIDEEQDLRRIGPLPVKIRTAGGVATAAAAHLTIEPDEVELVVRGSVLDLARIDPARLVVFVRPTSADLAGGAAREIEVHVEPRLAGVGVELRPPTVVVRGAP